MELTEQQVRFFNTFGYLCIRKMFSPDEIGLITSEFETAISSVGGANHDGKARTMFGGPIERTERLCTLLDDPRITGLIGGVIGDDFDYCSGDGNYYSGDTAWHPDGNWGELFAIKVAFYLDSLTKDTGCLRVIPGSQDPTHPIRTNHINVNGSYELFGVEARDYPGYEALETVPGDIVMFNHDTYHSAWGGGHRRRMFTMNCIRRCHTEREIELGKKYISIHSAGGYNVNTGAGMFYPLMINTASEKRMHHLAQAMEYHDELFPQFIRGNAERSGAAG